MDGRHRLRSNEDHGRMKMRTCDYIYMADWTYKMEIDVAVHADLTGLKMSELIKM